MADDGLLSLNPTPEQTEPLLQLNAPDVTPPVNSEVSSKRAYQASSSIPELNMSYDDVKLAIDSGKEQDVRQQAATALDQKKSEQRLKFIVGATRAERGLPPIDPKYVAQAIQNPPEQTDPQSVIEDAFAKSWMNQLDTTSDNNETFWSDFREKNPEAAVLYKTAGERYSAQREFIQKGLDEAHQAAETESWPSYLTNRAFDIGTFGLREEYKMRGLSPNVSVFKGLLSTQLQAVADDLNHTPDYKNFKEKYTTIMDGLKRDDPTLAVMFGEYMKGKSPDEQTVDNVFSAINLSILPSVAGGAAKLLRKGVSSAITNVEVKQAVKELIKADVDPQLSPAVANASVVGDATEAAVKQSTNNITRGLQGTANPEKEAIESLSTHLRVDRDTLGAPGSTGHWGREQVNRLQEQSDHNIINVEKTIADTSKIDRLSAPLATDNTVRKVLDFLKDKYPGISNNILDIGNPRWNAVSNTYDVDMFLGRRGGELFFNAQEAKNVVDREGLVGATVKSKGAGLGHYIVLSKPLNETDSIFRDLTHDAILNNKEHLSRKGIISDFASWLKTPEDTMSFQQRVNRKVATYGQYNLEQLVKENGKYIKDLARGKIKTDQVTGEPVGFIPNAFNISAHRLTGKAKRNWAEWDRTINANRDMFDPSIENPTALDKGYFFKTAAELDDHYMRNFQRFPSFEETSAYFAYVRNIELDRTLRNLEVYKLKSRVGAEQHSFTMVDSKGNKLKSNFFDGVQRRTFPGGKDNDVLIVNDGGVMVHRLEDEKPGVKVIRSGAGSLNKKTMDELKEGVMNGTYKAIEIYDPELRPLESLSEEIGSSRIRYVIAKNIETKPLGWDQVPRRGGGHFDYDYEHYIKQANIRPERIKASVVHWYEGDTTLMPVSLRAMGHKIKDDLNEIRALMAENRMDEAKALFQSKVPMELDWKEWRSWFEPSMKDGKKVNPRLNVKEPFYVVPKGKTIQELGSKELELRYPDTFKDGTKTGSLARQNQVQYTGQRDAYDLFTFKDVGKPGNPIYKYEPATMVDPIPSMNRALQRMINSSFMNDYKTTAIEGWIQEARDLLKASKEEIEASPFWHFENPDWKPVVRSKEAFNDWSRLMSNRFKIKQFVGTPNKIDTALHSVAQQLADTMYNKWGPLGMGVGPARLDPVWVASSLKDPFKFVRTMTFHAALGLYALPQLWVQAQTYALIFAISPMHAVMGTQAALLHQFARHNPSEGVLNLLDRIASQKMIPGLNHWKPGEWKEAFQEMNKTGFGHVGGEFATLDTSMSPSVVQSRGQSFLNAGAIPFREGERATRYGAWYTAYKEFRTLDPNGRITNTERNKMLERADLLTSNMSRASTSLLHNGVLSFPAQFLTYQIRNAELFWGKRLAETAAERNLIRARIFAVYSAFYGIPGALGVSGLPLGDTMRQVALGGQSAIPFVENVKKWATDHNYVIGDNFLTHFAMEGAPAAMLAIATGEGDLTTKDGLKNRLATGNYYNVGPRYGNQGFTSMREALQSDQPVYRLLSGAAGSKIADLVANLSPVYQAVKSRLFDDGSFKPKGEDIIRAASVISSVAGVHQGYLGLTTHDWFSRNGGLVEPVSPANAIFMTTFGLSPQKQVDSYALHINHQAELDNQKAALKLFLQDARSAIQAQKNNDSAGYDDYMLRARSYLDAVGYPKEKYAQAIAMASRGYESMIVGSERNYNLGKDIPEDERARRRQTQEIIEQQNAKRGQ